MTSRKQEGSSPLQPDGNGELCVAGTSVPFKAVLHALNRGHTTREIVSQFPELQPGDVHAVLVHYLGNGASAGDR